MPPSYDPALRLFFVTARETCATCFPAQAANQPGRGLVRRRRPRDAEALRRAARDRSDDGRAEVGVPLPARRRWPACMSTASGVVFAGDNEGNFMAFDARTGKQLWRLSDGRAHLGRRADDLHARRPPAGADRVGLCAVRVRVAELRWFAPETAPGERKVTLRLVSSARLRGCRDRLLGFSRGSARTKW